MKKWFTIIACQLILFSQAQDKVISLYQGKPPGSESWTWSENESSKNLFNTRVVYNVSEPTLSLFLPYPGTATGTALVICPGGGFQILSIDSEGFEVARWLQKKGVTCFVLKYRVTRSLTEDPVAELMKRMGNREEFEKENASIIQLAEEDARNSIRYVRTNAKEYGIDPDKIGIMGFSAGGTLTALATYQYDALTRPDFAAPVYPYLGVILDHKVPNDAPPVFLVAASDDQLGLAPHSVQMYNDWLQSKHSVELHLYAKGGHGFGMRKQNLPSDHWIDRFGEWLEYSGLLKKSEK